MWRVVAFLRDPSGEKRRIAAEVEAFHRFRNQLPRDRNPIHDWYWPECRDHLPHGHYVGTFTKRGG